MSIHQLAHHLQSAGRGEDKVLVHMTPKEVNGLQALAMAHGGSLTINPKTGLPEAGFLSAILPMVAGFFLGPAGLGIAQSALGAAAMVGGATGIATGSLTKGLMAGLGAYGGFGLADSLAAAGAQAAGTTAATTGANAAQTAANSQIGQLAAQAPGTVIPSASNVLGGGASTVTGTGALGGAQTASLNQSLMQGPFAGSGVSAAQSPAIVAANQIPSATQVALQPPVSVMQGGAGTVAEKAAMAQQQAAQQAAAAKAASTPVTNWENVKSGFNDVTSSGTKAWDFVKKNPMPFVGAGLGLLSDLSSSGSTSSGAKKQPGMMRPYEYSVAQNQSAYAPSDSTAERTYFTEPRFIAGTPYAAKEGGIMGYAVGGPVEQMSAQNAIGDNMMYPQSQLQTDMYSNPMVQRPMPTNVIHSGIDAPVGAYTGEMKMAGGGVAVPNTSSSAAKYSYDPNTMQYTMTSAPSSGNDFERLYGKGVSPFLGTAAGMMSLLTKKPLNQILNKSNSTEPVVGSTSGGVAAPYVPRNQEVIAQTPAPSVSIPAYQAPEQQLGLNGFYNMMGDQLAMKGAQLQAQGQGYAVGGGISDLGGYSDGGRLLRGPGDGVSDSIPASIGDRQPARLADGEFVVPARIVSEIGNGSTEAGAKRLYAMMDRVQKARSKTVGKNQVAKNTKAEKLLPA
jgi:hypothetical protein